MVLWAGSVAALGVVNSGGVAAKLRRLPSTSGDTGADRSRVGNPAQPQHHNSTGKNRVNRKGRKGRKEQQEKMGVMAPCVFPDPRSGSFSASLAYFAVGLFW